MATIDVKDAAGLTVAVEKPLAPGRTAAATSRPVALSTEDLLVLTDLSAKVPETLGQKAMAASLAVALASDQSAVPSGGNVAAGATDSGNPVKIGGKHNTTAPLLADGQRGDVQLGTRGSVKAELWAAGSNSQSVGAGQYSADNISAAQDCLNARAFGYVYTGATVSRDTLANLTARLLTAAASVNATNVKSSAGRLHQIFGMNVAVTPRYLKLYNKATAPTVGTDTPVATFYLPASAPFTLNFDRGFFFTLGIGFGLTTAAADASTAALTAGDVEALNFLYS